jgi:putative transcriptional regulator
MCLYYEVIILDRQEIGKKLLNLRGNKTRETVAHANGISVSALQMYENGQRIPRDEIKVKLARYYSTSIEVIFFTN